MLLGQKWPVINLGILAAKSCKTLVGNLRSVIVSFHELEREIHSFLYDMDIDYYLFLHSTINSKLVSSGIQIRNLRLYIYKITN